MSNSNDDGKVDSAEFARILTKQAVAHVCVAIGFTSTTPGALECLTDVVQRYLESMAKRTMENTYRAGRTEPNIPDVLQGFQQLPIPLSWTELRDFAFSEDGYSDRYSSSVAANGKAPAAAAAAAAAATTAAAAAGGGDGAEEEEAEGAAGREAGGRARRKELPKRWDQPFHHTVPAFPMPRKRSAPWGEAGQEVMAGEPGLRPPHIPAFMPPLPPSTSRETSPGSGRSLAEIRLERLKRHRQGKTALRSLGAPVAGGAAAAAAVAAAAAAGSGTNARSSNAAGSAGTPSSGKPGGIGKIIIRLPSAGATAGAGAGGGGGGGGGCSANGARRTSSEDGGGGGGRSGSLDGDLGGSDRLRQENGSRVAAGTSAARGFRDIVPNAAGASARLNSSSTAEGSAATGGGDGGASSAEKAVGGDGVRARVLKGFAGGGRGAFGRSNDSTREDRILEGMPPDGTADMDGVA